MATSTMTEHEWKQADRPEQLLKHLRDRHGKEVNRRQLRLFRSACVRLTWPFRPPGEDRLGVERFEADADGLPYYARAVASGIDDLLSKGDDNLLQICRGWMPGLPESEEMAWRQSVACRDVFGNPWLPVIQLDRDAGLGSAQKEHARRFAERTTGPVVVFDRAWCTETVMGVAYEAYHGRVCPRCEGREAGRPTSVHGGCPACDGHGRVRRDSLDKAAILVLSDALEEVGCDEEAVLAHLRRPEVCPACDGSGLREVLEDRGLGPEKKYVYKIPRYAKFRCLACRLKPCGPHFRGDWVLDLVLGREGIHGNFTPEAAAQA